MGSKCNGSSYIRNNYYIKLPLKPPTALKTANCVERYLQLHCHRIQLVYIDSSLLLFYPFLLSLA